MMSLPDPDSENRYHFNMTISLLNLGMMFGLIAVAVPIIVHLLNRRRFDVVEWGAMQFLQLGEKTRQKIKISDLLLLLLRMALVAILAMTFARPFVQGSVYLRSLYPQPIDLVIVIDSSYSMGWNGNGPTPHTKAIQECHHLLDQLTPVDRVAIIDARSRPRLLTPAPLTDTATARLELEQLQRPDGMANLTAALTQACELLTQSYSTRRDIVVLTDRQSISWAPVTDASWSEFLKLRSSAAVPIGVTAIDVGSSVIDQVNNFRVERLELSREVVNTQSRIQISTKVGYDGEQQAGRCELFWSVDGQQLSRETEELDLEAGETTVADLETSFADPGSHIITASLSDDPLPGDNVVSVVVEVLDDIPITVVLPEGAAQNTPDADDFFLTRVFGNPDLQDVWVTVKSILMPDVTDKHLQESRLLVLVNPSPDPATWQRLSKYIEAGGAVVVMLNSRADLATPQTPVPPWILNDQPLLPMTVESKFSDPDNPVRIDLTSLNSSWLESFKDNSRSDIGDALISSYWKTTPESAPTEPSPETQLLGPTSILARFDNGDPAIYGRDVGRGKLLFIPFGWDGTDSDLVRLRGFLPLAHEMVFGLCRSTSQRNIDLDEPILIQQLPCQPLNLEVLGPDDKKLSARRVGNGESVTWKMSETSLSGIYRVELDCQTAPREGQESSLPFSVFAPREESKLTRLSDEEIAAFQESLELKWRAGAAEVMQDLSSASGGLEIWPLLLLIVTAFLVIELLLTRRLVQGGHHQVETNPSP